MAPRTPIYSTPPQPFVISPQTTTAARSTDMSTWLLVALVVATVAVIAGWAVARQSTPSWSDLDSYASMAARNGEIRGQRAGYRSGVRAGNREAAYEQRLQQLRERPASYSRGWRAGLQSGRQMAQARAGYGLSTSLGLDDEYGATTLEDDLLAYPLSYDSDPGSWAYDAGTSPLDTPDSYGSYGSLY